MRRRRLPRSLHACAVAHTPRWSAPTDYIVEYKIGSGSFASVWKAHHRSDPSVLRAIKSVSREKLLSNRKHEENLAQEIDIMSKIQHRNIVRLYEVKVRNWSE